MMRRMDDQERRHDQTDLSFLYVRQDMTDVQNRVGSLEKQVEDRVGSLEKQVEELKELLTGRPVEVVKSSRAPVRCRICGESGHMANNSKFHPLMAPIFRATNPVQAQNPVMMTPANIQR